MSDPGPVPPCADSDASALKAPGMDFPIVGVGASAGGLEPLRQLLGALPADTGMAFIIVQHLAPAHASSLAEILSRSTSMPVREVKDEPLVQPNHVYVIPPARDIVIVGGKLQLIQQDRRGPHRGIDHFFRSLAAHSQHRAIGVVLSGGATDGTLGLEAIKAEGGVTFAQDESAQHESMPKSAIASGCVDFVLPPGGIAGEIARLCRHPYVAPARAERLREGPPHVRTAEIVRRATGVDFTHYKTSTMQRRILRRMLVHKVDSVEEYESLLQGSPEEVGELYQDLLIHVTRFFRNPETYEALAKSVIPRLLADRQGHDPIRIWTPGCSTGEEAYSLAMIYVEGAEAMGSQVPLQIFASDLNSHAIERARTGLYPRSIAQDVSPERLKRFFLEEDGPYRVCTRLRERIVFSRHNVLTDPPFSRIDFVSCRNLLIYLEPVLQQRLLPLLHYALNPGGYLWLGSSESLGSARDLFETEDDRHKIFRRRPGVTPLGRTFRSPYVGLPIPSAQGGPTEKSPTPLHREADRLLLARFAPPGVVVTADLEIVQFRGDTGRYLAPASGVASLQLLKMLREGLLVPVRAALERADREKRPVREEGARVRTEGGLRGVAVEVIPVEGGAARERGFVVLFHAPSDSSQGATPPPPTPATQAGDDEIVRLSQELVATREYLQSVVEQQDAANEELQSANEEAQSANEEMQSVNEELETSKEEIQSSNEELATVNDELNNRNLELGQLTNVLNSSQLSILIVSRDLRLRRFTPAAERMLNLVAGDVGRPLAHIQLSVHVPDLTPLLQEVINTGRLIERDTQDAEGRWYSLRVTPYQTDRNRVEGAVVTLVDVDALRRRRDFAESIVTALPVPTLVLDASLVVLRASRIFYDHFRFAPADTENRRIYDLDEGHWDIPPLRQLFEELLPMEHSVRNFEICHDFTHLGTRTMLLSAHRFEQESDRQGEPFIILSVEDITERATAARRVRESEALYRAIGESIDYGVWVCAPDGSNTYASESFLKLTGLTQQQCSGAGWGDVLHPDESATTLAAWQECVRTGGNWNWEHRVRGVDGQWHTILARGVPVKYESGKILCWAGINLDISELKKTEDALRASEERFRILVSLITDIAWTMDATGKFTVPQPEWEAYTGQAWEAHRGDGWINAIHPEDRESVLDAWRRALESRSRYEAVGRLFHNATGQWRRFVARSGPVLQADGSIREWVGTHIDREDERSAEDRLRKAVQDLARADRSKDEFLAMLSHELRNPLASLRNGTEILKLPDSTPEDRQQAHATLDRQIGNMTQLIDDLLDVARLREGKIALRPQPVSLEDMLKAATQAARPALQARKQELTLSFPPRPIYLDADRTRLEQAFGNLLSNACKFTGVRGHIGITVERTSGAEAGMAVVRVRDDGVGIAADVLPHVFELFMQADPGLDRAHGGLGIGLTLVQRLVQLHGGTVEVRSEGVGKGSEFIVRLPVLSGLPASPPPRPSKPHPVTPRRILIVDDNEDSARSMALLQQRHGHQTQTAFTGSAAVDVAMTFLPEVVLLDIGLPGMDGYEVARRLRGMPSLAGVFLIAMSGYGHEHDREAARRAGFDEYLVKPVDLERLRDLLRRPA